MNVLSRWIMNSQNATCSGARIAIFTWIHVVHWAVLCLCAFLGGKCLDSTMEKSTKKPFFLFYWLNTCAMELGPYLSCTEEHVQWTTLHSTCIVILVILWCIHITVDCCKPQVLSVPLDTLLWQESWVPEIQAWLRSCMAWLDRWCEVDLIGELYYRNLSFGKGMVFHWLSQLTTV